MALVPYPEYEFAAQTVNGDTMQHAWKVSAKQERHACVKIDDVQSLLSWTWREN